MSVKLDAREALEFNGCVFETQIVDPKRHHEILQRLALRALAPIGARGTPSLPFEVRASTHRNFAVLFRIASSALSQKVSPPINLVRSHQTLNPISPRRSVSQSANVCPPDWRD